MAVEQLTLNNGLRAALFRMPYLRSVSIGVWVKAGSILESPAENGLSHFMEHMAFKGTEKRTARQIAQEMDAMGGQLNAATSKVCTYYYARAIDEDLPLAADILSDIVIYPSLDADEMNRERSVILEEISMVADSPEDVVYDAVSQAMFGTQSLGQTILGPAEQIEKYTPDDIRAYRQKHYGPKNAVIALAGNVDAEQARQLLEEKFGAWEGSAGEDFPVETPNQPPQVVSVDKDTEQVHICLDYVGKELGCDSLYSIAILNSILGGGMSSRLFQRIREELGMAYSVYTTPSFYPHCGDFCIYAATNPKHVSKVLDEIDSEIDKLLKNGVTEQEFAQAKAQLRRGSILSLESASTRMNAMGGNLLLLGKTIELEETLARVEAVSREDVMDIAGQILRTPRSVAFVGRNAGKYEKLVKG